MSTDTNKQLVSDSWGALVKGDLDTFLDALADDVTWTFSGTHRFARTFSGKKNLMTGLFEPVFDVLEPGLKLDFVTMTAEDDRVVLEAKLDARSKAGKEYPQHYCYVITIADGKIKDVREYVDSELVTYHRVWSWLALPEDGMHVHVLCTIRIV